jgi:transcriptional regulator with XRE-family HTH domain
MPKSNTTSFSVPHAVALALSRLGANIAVARKRRALTQEDLAAKAGVTHVTLRRAERGSPGTSAGVYFAALWAMGLEAEIAAIASPDRDEVGKQLERSRLGKRVRRASTNELSDEF